MSRSIGFIGAGQMARALARGFCSAELVSPEELLVADVSDAAAAAFVEELPGSHATTDNSLVVQECPVVFIAVKPQHLDGALSTFSAAPDRLYVSIVAGATLTRLGGLLGSDRVVRVMPNTPCLVGAGASAYCCAVGVSADDAQRVDSLLAAVGRAVRVPESQMDAVTGLSGSGPAYIFTVIEALADGGVLQGLPRDTALQLAAQTVLGAARMVLETPVHPAELRDRVTSPGGTTAHGLQALESGGLRAALIQAVKQATERSRELGGGGGGGEAAGGKEKRRKGGKEDG